MRISGELQQGEIDAELAALELSAQATSLATAYLTAGGTAAIGNPVTHHTAWGAVIAGGTVAGSAPSFFGNLNKIFFRTANDILKENERDLSAAEKTFQNETKDLGIAKKTMQDCLNK